MSLLPTRFLAIFLILGLAACQSQQATQPNSGAQQVGESAAPESQAGMDGEFAA